MRGQKKSGKNQSLPYGNSQDSSRKKKRPGKGLINTLPEDPRERTLELPPRRLAPLAPLVTTVGTNEAKLVSRRIKKKNASTAEAAKAEAEEAGLRSTVGTCAISVLTHYLLIIKSVLTQY